jgi:hypothetical protein
VWAPQRYRTSSQERLRSDHRQESARPPSQSSKPYRGVACHVRHHASGSSQELRCFRLLPQKLAAAVVASASMAAQMMDRMIPSTLRRACRGRDGPIAGHPPARRGCCRRRRLDRQNLHGLLRFELDELLLHLHLRPVISMTSQQAGTAHRRTAQWNCRRRRSCGAPDNRICAVPTTVSHLPKWRRGADGLGGRPDYCGEQS